MTISAQVIETIVGWIDDNLHQPLRTDDSSSSVVGKAIRPLRSAGVRKLRRGMVSRPFSGTGRGSVG